MSDSVVGKTYSRFHNEDQLPRLQSSVLDLHKSVCHGTAGQTDRAAQFSLTQHRHSTDRTMLERLPIGTQTPFEGTAR